MSSYKTVRAVEKALSLLELLNTQPITRVKHLSQTLDIPHPTVIRLLETLEKCGYVRRVDRLAGYCVTEKTQQLSSGHHGFPKVLEILRQRADAMTDEILWPASLCTLDGDAMVVRYSTIPRSPLSHIHSTINRRLSLLYRAHGRAYMAFCLPEERDFLLKLATALPEAPKDFDRDAFLRDLESIRISGFARRETTLRDQTDTIAVPCWVEGRLVATVGLTYFTSSVPDPSALVKRLKQTRQNLFEATAHATPADA